MKHAVIGLTLAVLAATTSVVHAQDAAPPAPAGGAGNIEKASGFAAGDVSTVIAVGVGAAAAIAVVVIGAEGGGTSTATATTQ